MAMHAIQAEPLSPAEEEGRDQALAHYVLDECRAELAASFHLALAAAQLTRGRAAEVFGVARSLIDAWGNPDGRRGIALDRLVAGGLASRRGSVAARIVLVQALRMLGDKESGPTPRRDLRDLALDLAGENGEALIAIREALADGVLTDAERKTIARELADVERAIIEIRHALIGGSNG